MNDPEQYFQGDVELSEQQADGIQEELMEVLNDPLVIVDEPARKRRKIGKATIIPLFDDKRKFLGVIIQAVGPKPAD